MTEYPVNPAEERGDVTWSFHSLVDEVLQLEELQHYGRFTQAQWVNGLHSPQESRATQAFLDRHKAVVGGYYHGPDHPCNTNNVIGDLWSEFSHSMIFLRESDTPGMEPWVLL